jgi:hypothetical protein
MEGGDLKARLGHLARQGACHQSIAKNYLDTKDSSFSPRATMIAHFLFPTLAPDAADAAQILAAGQRRQEDALMLSSIGKSRRCATDQRCL